MHGSPLDDWRRFFYLDLEKYLKSSEVVKPGVRILTMPMQSDRLDKQCEYELKIESSRQFKRKNAMRHNRPHVSGESVVFLSSQDNGQLEVDLDMVPLIGGDVRK